MSTATAYGYSDGLAGWQQQLPAVQDVRIPSSLDGSEQPALWLPPNAEGPSPLLVVLHSWSYGYTQNLGIPFGQWATQQGWAMIHPDMRGANGTPQSTGSDLAVQDVVDAVDYAAAQADIDADRVFVVGFSGGGMMALLMAGRHPDRFAGVAAWAPIYDVGDFYAYHESRDPSESYISQVQNACGGAPTTEPQAGAECERRSPAAYLDAARVAGLPVLIAHGVDDDVVTPDHAARAFNQLAEPSDRLSEDVVAALAGNELPVPPGGSVDVDTYFAPAEPPVLLARRSGAVTLTLFDGEHDMVFNPGLEWMIRVADQQR